MKLRQHRALLVPCLLLALAPAPAAAAPAPARTEACTLVKGAPTGDGTATYDLALSGFQGNTRVVISGPGRTREARVASDGTYTAENVPYGDYRVKAKNRSSPQVTCGKAPREAEKPAEPKAAAVTGATAAQEGLNGKVVCGIFHPEYPVSFAGTITTSTPGVVTYRWTTSSGAVSGELTLDFPTAGTQVVPRYLWGPTGLDRVGDVLSGWAQIVISDKGTKSNQAAFGITCV
ncbi:hypothetical protein ACFW6V_18825 [Streptomyces sp. NPDC058734]|uniref:hypothetical protein n=1 Tax=Streptomyces sp. NPDC058734 TaxID=3346615 RepID=UPI0036B2FABE